MVERELKEMGHSLFTDLVFASQNFIRKVEEPYRVSLRDVKRAITLVKFFYNSLENRPAYKEGHVYPSFGSPTTITRCHVLSLSICYQSRLYDHDLRKHYRYEMGQIFQTHNIYVGENVFVRIVHEEQENYINRMRCPSNMAIHEALLENVLALIVCILTKIPIFIIGETGSSKSLAIHLINSNLRGSESNDEYFKKLPRVYTIPYLCSSSSTSDGIHNVFETAKKYQETSSIEFVEASVKKPLKILHHLLEPSYPATGPAVSFIGLSNLCLNISKSSRAILVQTYVSPKFKCILVMDEKKSHLADPSLLNRFEKQKLSISDVLDVRQQSLVLQLKDWTKRMTTFEGHTKDQIPNEFSQKDLFVGFDEDVTLQIQEDFIVYGTLGQDLFREGINIVLQQICNDKPYQQDLEMILSLADQKNQNLSTYFLDITLNLWGSDIKEGMVNKLFPCSLLVSNAYYSYTFIINEIQKTQQLQSKRPSIMARRKKYSR
ncbi:10103_t:CDS:2 [Funneliformis geosporum]|nr:10103_t:CDS:2 [Funneliformis geosporum]